MILTHYPGSFKSSANSGLPVKISAVENGVKMAAGHDSRSFHLPGIPADDISGRIFMHLQPRLRHPLLEIITGAGKFFCVGKPGAAAAGS